MATGSFLYGHHTHQSSLHTSNYPCIHPRTQKQQASRMVTELCQTPWHVLLWILPRTHAHTHTVTKWHTHTLLHGDTPTHPQHNTPACTHTTQTVTYTYTVTHPLQHTHTVTHLLTKSHIHSHPPTPTPPPTPTHAHTPNPTSFPGMHISASKSTQQVTTGGWQLDKRNSLTCFVGAVQRIVLSHHENLGPKTSVLLLREQQGKDLHATYTQHIHMLGKIKHKQLCWLQPDQP